MKETNFNYNKLQENLGYGFNDISLLKQALTRHSAVNEGLSNEDNLRLEYLGDKALGLVISDILMIDHPQYTSGQLTTNTSRLVRNNGPLFSIAKKLKIGKYLIIGKGEEVDKVRKNKKVLADTFEAVIGAIFLDCDRDYKVMTEFIKNHWHELNPNYSKLLDLCAKAENQYKINNQYGYENQFLMSGLINKIENEITIGTNITLRSMDKFGRTIFHFKFMYKEKHLVELILEKQKNWEGIDLRGISEELFWEYEYATDNVYYKTLDFEGISFKGANLEGIDLSDCTIKDVNFENANLRLVRFNNVEFINCNFEGANLSGTSLKGCTMDFISRQSCEFAIGRTNIKDIDVDEREFWKAVWGDQSEVVKSLILFKANVNYRDEKTSTTVLHVAAGNGYEEIVKLLVVNGANVNCVVKRMVIDYRDFYAEIDAAYQMINKIGKVPTLLKWKNCNEVIGATPLHLAAGNGHFRVVETLLEYGAKTKSAEWYGLTPNILASQFGYTKIVELLESYINDKKSSNSEVILYSNKEKSSNSEVIPSSNDEKSSSSEEIPSSNEEKSSSSEEIPYSHNNYRRDIKNSSADIFWQDYIKKEFLEKKYDNEKSNKGCIIC